jgi:hypothetical protein
MIEKWHICGILLKRWTISALPYHISQSLQSSTRSQMTRVLHSYVLYLTRQIADKGTQFQICTYTYFILFFDIF